MKIIKLNAIDSTNSFLKDLAQSSTLENYTTVVANQQTKGRGQINTTWNSEPFKNLTFSTFSTLKNISILQKSYLNYAISIAILQVLSSYHLKNLCVKWPNDIMADKQKICGILIETTFIGRQIKNVIIGIGLNVNQEQFPKEIPSAISMKKLLKKEINLDSLLEQIISAIEEQIEYLEQGHQDQILEKYLENLYQINVPKTFKNLLTNNLFMGIIKGVSASGNLQIQLEDNSIQEFAIKEVAFA